MNSFKQLIPGYRKADAKLAAAAERVDALKAGMVEVKAARDSYKDRAHEAEGKLKALKRAHAADPYRCAAIARDVLDAAGGGSISSYRERLATVETAVDVEDDMIWSTDTEQYFATGLDAARIVLNYSPPSDDRGRVKILDFPCGHGRVLRWLAAAYPDAALFGCDVQRHGMEFCRKQFGATPVEPGEPPSDMRVPEGMDIVWIGSLFTHLPQVEFDSLLAHLPNLLAPGGVVLFTTISDAAMKAFRDGNDFFLQGHDREAMIRDYEGGGFAYANYHHSENYGLAFSGEQYLREALAGIPGFEIEHFLPAEWSGLQDVCVCRRA